MAIKYLSGKNIQGVAADTKPTTAEDGSIFRETDTGNEYVIASGTWSLKPGGGGTSNINALTDVDTATAAPTNNQVLTWNSTSSQWVPATPPGSGGGEANTTSNVGTGEGTLALAKSGVNLPFKSLKQGTNITLTNNANDVTIAATGGVTASSADTFTNKNINLTNNTVTDTSTATGDLIKSNGTKFLRLAKGTSNQVLRVNSGATDLEWATLTGTGDVTLTGAQTLTNKTINRTNNTIPSINMYKYTIYQDGGVCKLVNNDDGTVASHATLGPAIAAVLADTNNPSVQVRSGLYNLASGFAGWTPPSKTKVKFEGLCFINVPQNYAGIVWKYDQANVDVYDNIIEGGWYDEQGTQTNDWTLFKFAPTHNGTLGAVFESQFKNIVCWRCSKVIHIATTGTSWVNQNLFEDIYGVAIEYMIYFEHSGTYTADASGPNGNTFRRIGCQSTAVSAGNHYPAIQGGIVNVFGKYNFFEDCNLWDFWQNPSAISFSFGANADNNKVIGGITTVQGYVNAGTNNTVDDYFQGFDTQKIIQARSSFNTWSDTNIQGRVSSWVPALNVAKQATAGSFEQIASFGTNASVDAMTMENGTGDTGAFSPLWRCFQTSANISPYVEGFHLQTYLKDVNDLTGSGYTVPLIIFAGRRQTNAAGDADSYRIVTRPIFGIRNYNTDILKMWKDRLDLLGNGLVNTSIKRHDNTIPYVSPCAFTIYRDGGAVKLVTNATGAVASHTTLGPAVDAVLANTADPSVEIISGYFDLASGFTGWNVVKLTNIKIHPNVYINVPQGFNGGVWTLSPTDNVVYNVTIDGGIYDEQGSAPTYLWDCIRSEPISTNPPTTTGAVYDCEFKNMFIWRCNRPIYLHTTGKSWINQNRFINIYTEGGKIIGAEFEHTGTYTAGASGPNGNYFECVDGQATALDTTNHFPATLYGFKNVIGDFNMFVDCKPWDLTGNGGSAHGMTIGANATHTKIVGGIVDDWGYVDSGINTSKDAYKGIEHNNYAIFRGRNEGWAEALTVSKKQDTGYEQLASFGLSGSSDTFTVENGLGTTEAGAFFPIWRSNQLSTNLPSWTEAFQLQANIKQANDTGNSPLLVFAGKTDTTPFTIGTTRPILTLRNYTTALYDFYIDRLDMKGNKLTNVSEVAQNPISKRTGSYQPMAPSSVSGANVGNLEGILMAHVPTGPGTNTNTWDTTEGLLANLVTTATANQNAGLVSPTGTIGILRREQAAKIVYRGKIDTVAGGVARLYIGVSSANAIPLTDTPIATGDFAVIVGFKSTATNYEIYANDGSGAHSTTAFDTPVAKNTSFHTIELKWTASGNIVCTLDGQSKTISTDFPATTTNLFFHCTAQNATTAIRTHSIVGVWVEST